MAPFAPLWRPGLPDPHQTLGLKPGADLKEVRSVYKELALRWHPDKHPDPETKRAAVERFQEIQAAYDRLVASHDIAGSGVPREGSLAKEWEEELRQKQEEARRRAEERKA